MNEPRFFPQFSELLSRYLNVQERSNSWLAGRLGINPSTVSRWLNYDSRPNNPELVGRIADALGVHDAAEREALFGAAGYLYRDQREATATEAVEETAPDPPTVANPVNPQQRQTTNEANFHSSVIGPIHTGSGNINLTSTATNTRPTGPFMVPSAPTHGIFGRDDNLRTLSQLLLLDEPDATDIPPVALHGLGGIGKTTLAVMLGRLSMIPSLYPDGVLWASVGPNPTIRLLLDSWGKALGVDLLPERDEAACRDRLRNILHYRQVLLLIDDVWEVNHGQYFMVAGPRCRTLLSTRETPIAHELATRQRALRLDVLKMEDAIALLNSLAPEAVVANLSLCQQFCETVEFLPLALTLAGRLLADQADVPTQMTRLLGELIERRQARLHLFQSEQRPGIEEKKPSLQAILGMSVERLGKEDQDRFAMASVFGGEPLTWDLKAASFVWECSEDAAAETTTRFIQRGLVVRRGERYWMHALLADYAAEMMEERGL